MFRHIRDFLAPLWPTGVARQVLVWSLTVSLFMFRLRYQFGEPGQRAGGGPTAAETLCRSGVAPMARDSIHAPVTRVPARQWSHSDWTVIR